MGGLPMTATFQEIIREDELRVANLSFRTTKKIKALAEIAASESNRSLSMYMEDLLSASFEQIRIKLNENVEETQLLAEVVDEFFDEDDVTCLFKLANHSQHLSAPQSRLLILLRTSALFIKKRGVYNVEAVRMHWDVLKFAVSDRVSEQSIAALSPLFPKVDVEFALMNETNRIKLYKNNEAEFFRRSQAYKSAIKWGA
jgi:hypothetical protein